ncbi:Protein ANTAGONIST OF LIKE HETEROCHROMATIN PROTEIN 1, partial [Frankliniella fusca]
FMSKTAYLKCKSGEKYRCLVSIAAAPHMKVNETMLTITGAIRQFLEEYEVPAQQQSSLMFSIDADNDQVSPSSAAVAASESPVKSASKRSLDVCFGGRDIEPPSISLLPEEDSELEEMGPLVKQRLNRAFFGDLFDNVTSVEVEESLNGAAWDFSILLEPDVAVINVSYIDDEPHRKGVEEEIMGDIDLNETAILMLEEALLHEEEDEAVAAELIGRMGARIMAWMEDDVDLLGEADNEHWVKINVDLEGIRNMGDPSFARHFRISKPTFEILLETLANWMMDNGKILRVRKRLDIPLLMVLWLLANPDTFRSVALHFGVLPGSLHDHYSALTACFSEMRSMYIKWPDAARRREISAAFEGYTGFPGIVGVIDGSHNLITAPAEQKEKYRNRHHTHSLNTQAVCDHNLLILDLHVGEVGSLHDSRVFRRSPLYRKLIENENDEMLDVGQHIIGDKAYALMDCVMVPLRNVGNLTEEQRLYNYSLCKSRCRVEHAFGKAFGQWRRMKMLHTANLDIAVDHIVSCFVLHNFMILNGEKLLDLTENDPTLWRMMKMKMIIIMMAWMQGSINWLQQQNYVEWERDLTWCWN